MERVALAFFAIWGWHLNAAMPIRIAAAVLVPLAAATAWGTIATSRDVVRGTSAPIMVSGPCTPPAINKPR